MKGDEVSGSFHCGFRCVIGHDEWDTYATAPRQQKPPETQKTAAVKNN